MFTSRQRQETDALLAQYVEYLQGQGQIGRQTLVDLSRILKRKAETVDGRYTACVIFPEVAAPARIPSPHTMSSGVWKVTTEFDYTVPVPSAQGTTAILQAGQQIESNVGFIVDLEMGSRNSQCVYLYNVEKGYFKQNPMKIINGKGMIIDINEATGLINYDLSPGMKPTFMDYAALDPVSLYARFRLVAASINVIPVTTKNPGGFIHIAQADDFDLPIKSPDSMGTDSDSPPAEAFVQFLSAPFRTMQSIMDYRLDVPGFKFSADQKGGGLAVDTPINQVFGSYESGGNLTTSVSKILLGNNIGWAGLFNLASKGDEDGTGVLRTFLKYFQGPGRKLDGAKFASIAVTEQDKVQGHLVNDNVGTSLGLVALSILAGKSWANNVRPAAPSSITAMLQTPVNEVIGLAQSYLGNTDMFEISINLIASMFPVLSVPRERNRRLLSLVKVAESPYQIKGGLNSGARMVYIPRSQKSLAYRDIYEVFEDSKKDVFWGMTQGLMVGDTLKFIITRTFEGVPHPSLASFLDVKKALPDAKTLELVDRIATVAPDLLKIPPGRVLATYEATKDMLGFINVVDNPIVSETAEAMKDQVEYERGLDAKANEG